MKRESKESHCSSSAPASPALRTECWGHLSSTFCHALSVWPWALWLIHFTSIKGGQGRSKQNGLSNTTSLIYSQEVGVRSASPQGEENRKLPPEIWCFSPQAPKSLHLGFPAVLWQGAPRGGFLTFKARGKIATLRRKDAEVISKHQGTICPFVISTQYLTVSQRQLQSD